MSLLANASRVERWEPDERQARPMASEALVAYAIFATDPNPCYAQGIDGKLVELMAAHPLNPAARELMRRLNEWERDHANAP